MPNNRSQKKKKNTDSFPVRVLIAASIVALLILILIFMGAVFKVLLFLLSGILIASFFRGIAGWVRRYLKIPIGWALGIVLISFAGFIFLINWLLAPQVVNQANQLVAQLPSAVENAQQYLEGQWWGRQMIDQLPENPGQFLVDHAGWAMQTFGVLSSTFGILSDVYVIVLIALFIMFNPAPYVNGLVNLVPISAQPRAKQVIHNVYSILQRWLAGKLISMLVVAVLTAMGLYILGMPLVLFLSFLAGILAFIPNFGPIISLIPALLVAILQGPVMALYILILYIIVQVIESNLITPFIQRKMVYLPLAMIVMAQVVLGILVGGLGLILATPIVAVLMVLIRMLYIEDILGQELVQE